MHFTTQTKMANIRSKLKLFKSKQDKKCDIISESEKRDRANTLSPNRINTGDTQRPRSTSSPKLKLFANSTLGGIINKEQKRVHSYKSFRILVLGPPAVGKSCILERFVNGNFTSEHLPTISETYETGLFLDMDDKLKQFDLELCDFSGEIKEEYTDLYRDEIEKADGFIVVYSKDNQRSFAQVVEIVADINNLKQNKASILVLENKNDLKHYSGGAIPQESFHLENSRQMAVSAKDNKDVQQAITSLIYDIEARENS